MSNNRSIMSFLKEISQDSAHDNEYVMYILVNKDLKMGKGKIASQSCHSVSRMTRVLERAGTIDKPDYSYEQWLKNGEPKVVLKASQEEMLELVKKYTLSVDTIFRGLWSVHTIDQGRTQIAPNSMTTMVFRPIMRKFVPDVIKEMKLL